MLEDSYPTVREETATLKVTRLAQGLRAGVGGAALLTVESGLTVPLREEGRWLPFPARSEKPEKAMPRLAEADPAPRPCVTGPGEARVLQSSPYSVRSPPVLLVSGSRMPSPVSAIQTLSGCLDECMK